MKQLRQINRLFTIIFMVGCSGNDVEEMVDCSQSGLVLNLISSTDATSCTASDGKAELMAEGGSGDYTFSFGTNTNNAGGFDGLSAGTYLAMVSDGNKCEAMLEVTIGAAGSTLVMTVSASSDTECLTNNGSVTAMPDGGSSPYEFRINDGTFGASPTFNGLKSGTYTIEVKDSEGCILAKSATVAKGNTGVSFSSEINPIITSKCAISGCHNGDNGSSRNWTLFSNVQANAANIKTRTGNRSMPLTGSLTQEQIDLIACWVDDGAKNN